MTYTRSGLVNEIVGLLSHDGVNERQGSNGTTRHVGLLTLELPQQNEIKCIARGELAMSLTSLSSKCLCGSQGSQCGRSFDL
jgi:hypothetical protein